MQNIKVISLTLFIFLIFSCQETVEKQKGETQDVKQNPIAYSLSGAPFFAPEPSKIHLEKLKLAKVEYNKDSINADNIIWYGRRLAYVTKYKEAIDIFSKGIKRFPEDARMYRHRGHRYISIRKFDSAISDFEKAAQLIQGKENEIEPDGLPNAQNIPVSTLHGNIWYHLGLAYYLKQDWPKALDAYLQCRETGTKPDNMVSSTHWIYMINQRMNQKGDAIKSLNLIEKDMEIIENFAYHKLCLFYKNEMQLKDLNDSNGAAPSNDAILYGIANWYFYNNEKVKAKEILEEIIAKGSWNSFGYIAAESDLFNSFSETE